MAHTTFQQLLEDGDLAGLQAYWREYAPGMPQATSRDKAEIVMHMARTGAESVSMRRRAYSHRWLTERLLPSQLPDELKPAAERLYPSVVEAVGVAVKFSNPVLAPVAQDVRTAMSDVVEDMYAAGDREPLKVKARMLEARDRTLRLLFGR